MSIKEDFASTQHLAVSEDGTVRKKGMNYWVTGLFLAAQMAGAGFLALPYAVAATGWIGIPLLVVFCVTIGFAGIRLGYCWVILEERWPEYRKAVRQPYMDIADRAYGKWGRGVALACVLITLIGASIVFLILIAQFLHALASDYSICLFTTVASVIAIPLTWLGTPKDFWQGSVLAVIATAIACVVIFVQMLLDRGTFFVPEDPLYRNPTISSFSVGFGTILFAFGGASAFPTIQNDMNDRTHFWKSLIIAFAILLLMYFPVDVTSYVLLGYEYTPSNILLYRGDHLTVILKVAIVLQIFNLVVTFLICFNPVCQTFEDFLNIPSSFGWKRCAVRSSIMCFELFVALALPDFGLIVNLIGGSTNTICSFILPPLMYLKLVDDKSNKAWPERFIPLWERTLLYEIVMVGTVGGICSTVTAIYAIINTPFSSSCLADFSQTS